MIFELWTKIGPHVWRRSGVRLEPEDWARLPDRLGVSPADVAEKRELLTAVRAAVDRDLSERQRTVFVAIAVDGTPLDAVVAELGTNRNAVYKIMSDARRKLRQALVAEGYLPEVAA